jgi:hypothetical protein
MSETALDEHDVAELERLIRRMSVKQRGGLDAWLTGGSDLSNGYLSSGPLWPAVKEAQEYVDWYEVAPGEPWGTPQERRRQSIKVIK